MLDKFKKEFQQVKEEIFLSVKVGISGIHHPFKKIERKPVSKINQEGLGIIKFFESCELEAYPDPGSQLGLECTRFKLPMRHYRQVPSWAKKDGKPWTIGYGHTGKDVFPGKLITKAEAEELLLEDVEYFEKGVLRLVKVELTENQFSALVSFAYNCGLDEDTDDKAEGLGDSTLLKLVNQKEFVKAADQFLVWTKAKGKTLPGLVKRREEERKLFLS